MGDVWYSYEPFHCGDEPPGNPKFLDMFSKVSCGCAACSHALDTVAGSAYCPKPAKSQLPPAVCYDVQVVITSMLWGVGTAIGEVPPYLISYSAAKAGQEQQALAGIDVEEEEQVSRGHAP